MKDLYQEFAYDYDKFGAIDKYLGNESDFFKELFSIYKVHTVLDCACGTGQHLLMLSELGFEVCGSDYSEAMLKVADENLKLYGKKIPLCQCDFRYLEEKQSKTFDAIVCLSTSLPHLHTDEDLIVALKSMKKRLNENGILVLTQGTTHYTLSLPSIEVVVNRTDFSRIFVKKNDKQFQTIQVLDLFHSKERNESNQYDIVYKIILDQDYRKLLSESGFKKIQIYGDYDMRQYDENSRRLIVVAQ